MKEFSLLGFAAFLAELPATVEAEKHEVLEASAKIVEAEAKHVIGTYQSAAGPFEAWAPLADTTLEGWQGHPGKVDLGYAPPDNPLLREGDMRDSIEHKVRGDEAHIGSDSDIAVYQELGTEKMPPRSFLGMAAVHKEKEVVELIGSSVVKVLSGGGVTKPIA